MLKIDYQANSKNKYSFRANYEKDNNQNVGIGAAGSLNHTLGNATNQTPWGFRYAIPLAAHDFADLPQ